MSLEVEYVIFTVFYVQVIIFIAVLYCSNYLK